jgi:hypothetical protein
MLGFFTSNFMYASRDFDDAWELQKPVEPVEWSLILIGATEHARWKWPRFRGGDRVHDGFGRAWPRSGMSRWIQIND